jgi:cytochrome c oxidase subunit 2
MRSCFVFFALLLAGPAAADWQLNMEPGVTEISAQVYSIHMIMFWVCVVIGIAVFSVMFYSMIKHRKSKGAVAANFHESTLVEIIWTIIPVLILVALAFPAVRTLANIYDKQPAEVTVMVTGYQWKWQYKFLDEDEIEFFSVLSTPSEEIRGEAEKGENYLLEVDEPLVVPVNTRIRLLFTAADVIHSWWVPELAIKKDAVPGIVNESWTLIEKEGIYRGQCTELCGKDHGFMPVVVKAVSETEYQAWRQEKLDERAAALALAQQDLSLEELMVIGEEVYQKACAACHMPDGNGIPPAMPALNASDWLKDNREGHILTVLNGRPGTAMAAYGSQLSDLDMAAVITYERNAWDNKLNDRVTIADVQAVRESVTGAQ